LALFAAEKALDDDKFMNECLQLNLEQKELLYTGLETLGYEYLPSKANFISFDCKENSTDAFNKLLHHGVIVRSLGVYKMPNHLRVSIGTPKENLLFLEKLKLTSS
jgi:histidinol-phosphate aminotransferase